MFIFRADTSVSPYINRAHIGQPLRKIGHPQGFKPRIARIARIILGQHETDDTDFASGCALAPPG